MLLWFQIGLRWEKSSKGVDADCSRAEFVLLAQKAKAAAGSK